MSYEVSNSDITWSEYCRYHQVWVTPISPGVSNADISWSNVDITRSIADITRSNADITCSEQGRYDVMMIRDTVVSRDHWYCQQLGSSCVRPNGVWRIERSGV